MPFLPVYPPGRAGEQLLGSITDLLVRIAVELLAEAAAVEWSVGRRAVLQVIMAFIPKCVFAYVLVKKYNRK